MDGERDTVDQAVRDLNRMDGECSQLDALVGPHLVEVGVVEQAVLVEFVFDVGERELRAPDWHVEFGENPGEGADMVFVSVCEDNAAHALAIFSQIRDVGDNDVDAEEFGFGEHESAVDDDDVIAPTHGHAVHAELAKAAEGDDLQFSAGHGVRRMLAQSGEQ